MVFFGKTGVPCQIGGSQSWASEMLFMNIPFEAELAWTRQQMPRKERALAALPNLRDMRLACSMHLDLKIIPLIEGLLARRARLFLTTCDPATVRDPVVDYLRRIGAEIQAWHAMPPEACIQAAEDAIAWDPTHLCEFGADLTAAFLQASSSPAVRASLEGTGSGIARLQGFQPLCPIYNWDDLPIKEGLHNRHMVGLTTWHTFFARTRLTLHGKRVVVFGYGLVGQGPEAADCAFGGTVLVVEPDRSRALQAAIAGWPALQLDEALPQADVVVTATGAQNWIASESFQYMKDGVFLPNAGHAADEIDLPAQYALPHSEVIPQVEEFVVIGCMIYLFAGGAMANLAAGEGDSLNVFEITLAVLTAGIGYIAGPARSSLLESTCCPGRFGSRFSETTLQIPL